MNVTFLLGNGFDMQLGMKTGYKHFLRWYTLQPTNDDDIAAFRYYLKKDNSEWWSDAEIAMGKYLGQFSDDNISIYYKNIRDFKLRLAEYLKEQNMKYNIADNPTVVERFKNFLLNSADDVMLRKDSFMLQTMRMLKDTSINFVSFNYTDAIDKIVNAFKKDGALLEKRNGHPTEVGAVYHVHGTLDSALIMGVDNFDQLDTMMVTDTPKLRRTLIKPIVNEQLGRSDSREAENLIKDSRYVFLYGLSFGDTDARWWSIIKEKLVNDASFSVALFTRSTNEDIQEIIPEDIMDYENDKKDAFLLKIGIEPQNMDIVRDRVFIIRNTERLHISLWDIKIKATV